MKILYLYAELMGYQIPILKEYSLRYGAEVHVIHWNHKKLTPYEPPNIKNVKYYDRSKLDYQRLLKLVKDINPQITFISGWMDRVYLKIGKKLKQLGNPVVAGCDTQAQNKIKHLIMYSLFSITYKKSFTHIWVAGPYQYEYARKLGFKKSEIIFNLYSADSESFKYKKLKKKYPKNFLFLGRLEEVKGISLLLNAWKQIQDKKGWSLTFIGNGSYSKKIKRQPNVKLKEFMQPEKLIKEIQNYGFLILPSIHEPWALVIQESMSAGIPVLASNVCGASPVFIIPNYSGFTFKSGDITDLVDKMKKIISLDEHKLKIMSSNAFERSGVINPKISAASFMSVLENRDNQ